MLLLTCLSSAIGQSKEATLELKLDRAMLEVPCSRQRNYPAKYRTCPDDGMTINVEATIGGKIGKNPRYEYSVSGGTLFGIGPKVIWDMSKARPGTYAITSIANFGAKKTKLSTTKTITLKECDDCNMECLGCPSLRIHSLKETISPGEIVEFSLAGEWDGEFRWSIDGGEVIAGQGTDRVTVRVDPNLTRNAISINAKVVDGGFCFEVWKCPDHTVMELQVSAP